jgi:hypothetical protein
MENAIKIYNDIVIYQSKSGALEFRADIKNDTLWATQTQIADLFNVDRTVATKHINNILKEGEVNKKSNVQKMHIPNSDRPVSLYSLDIILAVGYRTNSSKAIIFRKWATATLRQHIIKGYTINKTRIAANYEAFMRTVQDVRALLPASSFADTQNILELITLYADTWLSLDAYDKDKLTTTGATRKSVQITSVQLNNALLLFKKSLIKQGSATDLFGSEVFFGSIKGIIGNVMQSFAGKDLYPTIEEKAAHLLYFIVKNHPFIDGNKRSGAYSFIWFLRQAEILDLVRITPPALTALTLLIAESKPSDKEKMIGLVCMLLKKI